MVRYWLCLIFSLCTFYVRATTCADIWPSAVDEYTNAALPAGLIYQPSPAVAINSFQGTFAPGDYTIGTHSIGNGVQLRTTGKTTRIFVDGSLVINNNVELNAYGAPENLIIVVRGSLTVYNNVVIRGFVVAGGSVFFSNNASIRGGLTAVGDISGRNNALTFYDSDALSRLQGGVVCTGAAAATQIDHYEFVHAGSALTCNPASVTLKACKTSDCSELITSSVSATLSPSSGWSGTGVNGNTVTFTGGSTTLSLRQSSASTVTLGITASTPSQKASAQTLCQVGTGLSSGLCALSFADSGFIVDVPTKLANKPASGIKLRAVKSDGSARCVPSFANVSRTIKLWSDLVSPSTYPGTAPAVTVNAIAVGVSVGTATTQTLSFDSQGESTLSVNYADAGQLRLNARYDGTSATGDSGLVMTGSDLFVSHPAGFCLTTPQTCPLSANDAAYASCALFRRAGESFSVTVSAKAWESDTDSSFCTGNSTTKNFVSNSMGLNIDRLAPQTGVTGALSNSQLNFTTTDQGQTQLTTSYNEVGVVRFRTAANTTYEGTVLTSTGQQELATGRIGPYQFKLDNASVVAGCSSFSYMGQPLNSTASFSARAASGMVLSNYQGVFAKASSQLVAREGNTNLSARLQYTTNVWQQWNAGQLLVVDAIRLNRSSQPDGPFTATAIGVRLQANDPAGVGSAEPELSGLNLNPDVAGTCTTCTAWQLGSSQQFRYGRLRILEAFGSELAPLPIQLLAEYYNGQQFVSNPLDSCSEVAPAALTATGATSVSVSGQSGVLQAGISGAVSLLVAAPQQPGIWQLQYDLATAPWLQYDWQPGQGALLENPTAQAVFGIFRGQNRQIFWREQ